MDFEMDLSANKNKLFSIATDFSIYKKLLPDNILDVKIIQETGDEIITQERLLFSSVIKKEIDQQSKHKIIQGDYICSEIISGPLKGSVMNARFLETSTGTKQIGRAHV